MALTKSLFLMKEQIELNGETYLKRMTQIRAPKALMSLQRIMMAPSLK